ncbi:hypothetical protein AWH69_15265 [Janibacter melonis]|uniref:Heparinase II/III-like C-terminal domain-containing protein n=1 Tax=Janibacter melonis TaxID=262209 RepID=A0A176Q9A4_9MICO|nr:heparinase II/III family protein [Janibacter melonis]OAB86249.1 hypothetical protein AWH69_15265 [Janibacter melonis]
MTADALSRLHDVVRGRLPKGEGAARIRARRFLEEGLVDSVQFGEIRYDDGRMWDEAVSRSRSRFVHGFLWFADWPALIRDEETAARRAYELSQEWREQSPLWRGLDGHLAFHDETTAQRLTMHLAVMDGLARWLSPAELEAMHITADETADLLVTDDFHGGLNNHGMFQDVALVNWAGAASWAATEVRERYLRTALDRLARYFRHAFTDEGVHIEHAPNYHLMVARHLQSHLDVLRAVGTSDLDEFEDLLAGTLAYATHAVAPDGLYPLVSDTTRLPLAGAARELGDDSFLYAATQGKQGREPGRRTHVVPASGYAIHRSAWGDPQATFVYFSCAYNGPFHKHADENSLLVRHRGLDLISEAGPNGYSYDEPLTRYGYSQYAHSTLVVDGRSLPRTGGPTSSVTMEVHRDDAGFSVTGRNARLRDEVVHERTVDVDDAATAIDVYDAISAPGRHHYEILWHVGADLEVVLHGQGYELRYGGQKVMDVMWEASTATRVSLRRGAGGSSPKGWRFPTMGHPEPSDVVVVSFEGADVELTTRIRLSDFIYRDRDVTRRAGWRRWTGSEVGVNFLPVPGRRDRLVVAFASTNQVGDFTSNYKPTVDGTGIEARYILDDWGDQGCYYFQDHGDRAIFRSVQDLILDELDQLGLTPMDLVCIGSGKGGTAALLHGLSLGAGEIFVGAPQTRVGSFLREMHPNILRFMTGNVDDRGVGEADRMVFDMATAMSDKWAESKVTIVVGERDHRLLGQVRVFAEHVADLPGTLDVITLPGLTHTDIGPAYRDALAARLTQITGTVHGHGDLTVRAVAGDRRVSAMAIGGAGTQFAARLFQGADHVRSIPYSPSRSIEITDVPPGRYRVRVFARDVDGELLGARTSQWVTVR